MHRISPRRTAMQRLPVRTASCVISDQSTLSALKLSTMEVGQPDLSCQSLLHLSSLSLSASHSLLGPLISHFFTSLI